MASGVDDQLRCVICVIVVLNLPGMYFPGGWVMRQCLRDLFKHSNSTIHNRKSHGWITITQQIDWLELSENRAKRKDGRHLRKSLNSVLKICETCQFTLCVFTGVLENKQGPSGLKIKRF